VKQSLVKIRESVGGALIKTLLNTVMRGMRYHPKAWGVSKGIRVLKDIPYGTDPSIRERRLNVYMPEDQDGPLPVMLYIHGGGFRILSKDTHWMMNQKFARKGFVVFSINYRLVPSGQYPAALQDVFEAVKWIKAHAHNYGADASRWCVGGESAGGNLSLALTIANASRRPEPWAAEIYDLDLPIKAVLPACGILQVSDGRRFKRRKEKIPTLIADRIYSVCREYLGESENEGSLADPLLILESDWVPNRPLPPMVSVVGTRDPIIDDTRRLGAALTRRGVPNAIHIYPGGIHAFHAVYWSPMSREAWAHQFVFLDEHFPTETQAVESSST
jgi:acetyl esterase/lipase